MAAIDIGEAKALAKKLAAQTRDEALRLGSQAWDKAPKSFDRAAFDKAWAKAPSAVTRLLEEPKSFLASFRPPPPEPPKTHWAYVAGVAALGFVAGAAAVGAGKAAARAIPANADWLGALKTQQDKIEDLFDALLETTDTQVARRKLILGRLRRSLDRGALAEQNVLHPMLHEANRTAVAKELASSLFDIRAELHSLSESGFGDFSFIGKIEALRILVEAHLRRQEAVYPDFQSGLSESENLKLARAIAREGLRLG